MLSSASISSLLEGVALLFLSGVTYQLLVVVLGLLALVL